MEKCSRRRAVRIVELDITVNAFVSAACRLYPLEMFLRSLAANDARYSGLLLIFDIFVWFNFPEIKYSIYRLPFRFESINTALTKEITLHGTKIHRKAKCHANVSQCLLSNPYTSYTYYSTIEFFISARASSHRRCLYSNDRHSHHIYFYFPFFISVAVKFFLST